jgi:hypothetical protein
LSACGSFGGISDTEALLGFLHHNGVCFTGPGCSRIRSSSTRIEPWKPSTRSSTERRFCRCSVATGALVGKILRCSSGANSNNRANIYSSVLCAILTPYLVAPVNTFSSTSAGILEGRPGHGASSKHSIPRSTKCCRHRCPKTGASRPHYSNGSRV